MRVTLDTGDFGTYLLVADDGRDILIQVDYDYPSIAGLFGWSPCCGATDGTVDCAEHGRKASDMIAEAGEWLADHVGESADDPGYFDSEGSEE